MTSADGWPPIGVDAEETWDPTPGNRRIPAADRNLRLVFSGVVYGAGLLGTESPPRHLPGPPHTYCRTASRERDTPCDYRTPHLSPSLLKPEEAARAGQTPHWD